MAKFRKGDTVTVPKWRGGRPATIQSRSTRRFGDEKHTYYMVQYDDGKIAWYDESEVEPIRKEQGQ